MTIYKIPQKIMNALEEVYGVCKYFKILPSLLLVHNKYKDQQTQNIISS